MLIVFYVFMLFYVFVFCCFLCLWLRSSVQPTASVSPFSGTAALVDATERKGRRERKGEQFSGTFAALIVLR